MGRYSCSITFYLIVCGVVACISCMPNPEADWRNWKQKFDKTYMSESEDYDHRRVWMNNYKYVQEHNNSSADFSVELNFMADKIVPRTPIEYNKESWETWTTNKQASPDSWDWRTKGAISPVKNQGQLGDVQSIVATECMESYADIVKGRLMAVSSSEVHDCCVKTRVAVDDVFTCIHGIGGLCSETSYPKIVGRCMNNTCQPVVQVNGGKLVPSGDEMALKDAVYTMPVMVLIDASHASFQLYRSGIYSDPKCSSQRLDHSLQVVGYGSIDGKDFWICKNSWGVNWGMQGYINIARNHGNMCGIATHATYPV